LYIQAEVLLVPRRVPSTARVVNYGKDEMVRFRGLIITFGEMPSRRRWVM